VLASAAGVSVQVVSPGEIDRAGLHRSNLNGLRRALHALSPPAEACLVDGFRLGPSAPCARRGVDGDERSAAIAAASIVAKVVRDRRCSGWTRSIRATGSRRTSGTSRRATRGSSASTARVTSTAARSKRSAT
jgi:Ribonuclease HII